MRIPREHRYSVYILGSLSGTLYIGMTSNLPFRVRQHKEPTFRGFTAKYVVDRLALLRDLWRGFNSDCSRKTVKGLEAGEKACADRKEQSPVEGLESRVVRKASENHVSRIGLGGDRGPSTPVRETPREPPLRMTDHKNSG